MDNSKVVPASATDADEGSVREELEKVRLTLRELKEDLQCGVCHTTFTNPVSLPCGHSFCSECVRRFLLTKSRCPEAHCTKAVTTAELRPVRALEAVTLTLSSHSCARLSHVVPSTRGRIAQLVNPTRTLLVSALRSLGLKTEGTLEQLTKRHREFALLWNANLDARSPQPETAIVSRVMEAERVAAADAMRGNTRSITNLFRRRSEICSYGAANGDQPEEGDSFGDLITKIRRRENRPEPHIGPLLDNEFSKETRNDNSESARRLKTPTTLHVDERSLFLDCAPAAGNKKVYRAKNACAETQSPSKSDIELINTTDCASLIPDGRRSLVPTPCSANTGVSPSSLSNLTKSTVAMARPNLREDVSKVQSIAQTNQVYCAAGLDNEMLRAHTQNAHHRVAQVTTKDASVTSVASSPQMTRRYGAGDITVGTRLSAAVAASGTNSSHRSPTSIPLNLTNDQRRMAESSDVMKAGCSGTSFMDSKTSTEQHSFEYRGASSATFAAHVPQLNQANNQLRCTNAQTLQEQPVPHLSEPVQVQHKPEKLRLTEEQRVRIEQNRLRAIERQKAAKKRRLAQLHRPG